MSSSGTTSAITTIIVATIHHVDMGMIVYGIHKSIVVMNIAMIQANKGHASVFKMSSTIHVMVIFWVAHMATKNGIEIKTTFIRVVRMAMAMVMVVVIHNHQWTGCGMKDGMDINSIGCHSSITTTITTIGGRRLNASMIVGIII